MFPKVLHIVAGLLLVILAACTATQYKPATLPASLMSDDHIVGASDVLAITVFGEDDLSGDYTVAGNGQIDMPLAGPITVEGHPVADLPGMIEDAYRGQYLKDPKVSIALKTARPFFILGGVKNPGSYTWQPGLTVLRAVAMGGGYTNNGTHNGFDIIRGGQTLPGAINPATPLLPGDVVRVKDGMF